MALPRLGRYTVGARVYDVVSAERPVYRVGREAAIAAMALKPGDRVLDVGCGTGLNLPLLREAVGPQGSLVGLDRSPEMLAQARRRVTAARWDNVELVEGDAGDLAALVDGPFDAALSTYALSIIPAWQETFAQMVALVRPGGRLGVVDLALPDGRGRVWRPLARLAMLTGGVDAEREPWRLVHEQLDDVAAGSHRAGHVVTAVGTRR